MLVIIELPSIAKEIKDETQKGGLMKWKVFLDCEI